MNLHELMANAAVERIGWTLVHFVWQGATIALALAVVLLLSRRASAAFRYLASCAAMALMVLSPLVTFVVLPGRQSAAPAVILQEAAPPIAIAPAVLTAMPEFEPVLSVDATTHATPPVVSPTTRLQFTYWVENFSEFASPRLPWVVGLWLAGVFALSIRLLGGWIGVQRLRGRSVSPLEEGLQTSAASLAQRMGLKSKVRLLESAFARTPMAFGWLRPMILLPASAITGLTPSQLEAILAHELAHIRRHDYLVNLFQCVVETLLFYHPAVWWVSARIRAERENCCDDLVLAACGDAVNYARALARIEEFRSFPSPLPVAATGGILLNRIKRLLGVKSDHGDAANRWLAGLLALLAVACVAGLPQLASKGSAEDKKVEVSTPQSPWSVDLPDGGRAELIAITEGGGQSWWQPDGSPLAMAPDVPPDEGGRGHMPGWREFKMAYRMTANPDNETRIGLDGDFEGCAVHTPTEVSSSGVKCLFVSLKNISPLTLKFGVAASPWKTVSSSPPSGTAQGVNKRAVIMRPARAEGKETVVETTHTFSEFSVRLEALLKDGSSLIGVRWNASNVNDVDVADYRFKCRPDRIKELHFQTRPIQWYGFRNVALTPGGGNSVERFGPELGAEPKPKSEPKDQTRSSSPSTDQSLSAVQPPNPVENATSSAPPTAITEAQSSAGKSDPPAWGIQLMAEPPLPLNNPDAAQPAQTKQPVGVQLVRPGNPKAALGKGSVELVAVGQYPIGEHGFWKPDGSPLDPIPFGNVAGPEGLPKELKDAYLFVFRVDGPADAEYRYGARDAPHSAGLDKNCIFDSSGQPANLMLLRAEIPNKTTTQIDFASSTGAWSAYCTHPARLADHEVPYGGDAGGVIFKKATVRDGKTIVSLVHSHPEVTARIIAVKNDGVIIEGPSSSGASVHGMVSMEAEFGAALKDIKEFQLQLRPFRDCASFKDIALKPRDEKTANASPRDKSAQQLVDSINAVMGDGMVDWGDGPIGRLTTPVNSADLSGASKPNAAQSQTRPSTGPPRKAGPNEPAIPSLAVRGRDADSPQRLTAPDSIQMREAHPDRPRARIRGGSVELIAVSQYPVAEHGFWAPDGSRLDPPPFGHIVGPAGLPDELKEAYLFIFRVDGPTDAEYRYAASDATHSAGLQKDHVRDKSGKIIPNLMLLRAEIKDKGTTEITFLASTGDWKILFTHPASSADHEAPYGGDPGGVIFRKSAARDGKTVLPFVHSYPEDAVRLVAVQNDGSTLDGHPSGGASVHGMVTTEAEFDAPLSEIREFQFQMRPFLDAVKFQEINLKPREQQTAQNDAEVPLTPDSRFRSQNTDTWQSMLAPGGIQFHEVSASNPKEEFREGSVELVAVSQYPPAEHGFWKPDGSRLEPSPIGGIADPNGLPDTLKNAYLFIFRVEGPANARYRYRAPDASDIADFQRSQVKDGSGQIIPNMIVLRAAIIDKDTTSIDFLASTGGWVKASASLSEQDPFYSSEKGGISFKKVTIRGGKLDFAVVHSYPKDAVRLVAVKNDGEILEGHPSSGANAFGSVIAEAEFDAPMSDIKEFRFLMRQFADLIRFKQVALKPR